jgi:hypothetical protein
MTDPVWQNTYTNHWDNGAPVSFRFDLKSIGNAVYASLGSGDTLKLDLYASTLIYGYTKVEGEDWNFDELSNTALLCTNYVGNAYDGKAFATKGGSDVSADNATAGRIRSPGKPVGDVLDAGYQIIINQHLHTWYNAGSETRDMFFYVTPTVTSVYPENETLSVKRMSIKFSLLLRDHG